MTILCQKSMPWGNEKLGTSAYYIWAKGCLITELAEILNTTPDVINQRLINVSGFAPDATGQVSLLIWNKIAEAFPGVSVRRVWSYDNNDVHIQLNAGSSVMVEVPADPIGNPGGKHWVRYIGNEKLHDPWTGTERPTSDFPNPTGYAVVSGSWTQETKPEENPAPSEAPANPEPSGTAVAPNDAIHYKGLDLTNTQSVKAAIDTWYEVAQGTYIPVVNLEVFSEKVCEALGIDNKSDLNTIVQHISSLKQGFQNQVQAAVIPDPSAVEGQGPAVSPAPQPSLTNIPQHEKDAVLSEVQKALDKVKELFGL